ncbi:MAG: Crp/Fnr family transcriptional regulator [Gammaproteobacteria bacterium]|jgi:CRP/FNR family transcriptional regulator, cyclic AMP receptor protein|nr:Crp/Fnr family transcriptional regulator [Gammaproteobacteria bacterium]MBU1351208.1 Crp/Fnr family transcriptional regulator [Gammaproteobacteria bacterium]MBU1504983.1 Crp/Fnr family transcriptional regulator [Gammaproteobacteria bacterium]MBU1817188.1 Crp/Fnr family transcriptional regulator [Gammaproteobacteria bacterium]MBU2122182.1 Crp/Fnr family transcriptional regulator [Gammaproteobacteria bacterium]
MLVKLASPNIADLLKTSAWFPVLDDAAQQRVLDDLREVDVPQGAALCRRGDTPVHWYGAIDGLLKWTVTSGDGRSVTLGGLSAGSWFGEGTLLRGVPRTADIIALRPSRVALLSLDTFNWLHATQRSFDHFLLRQINERMHWFLGTFTAHHLLDTDSQVARALAGLFHPFLYPGMDRHLQISQEEIANLTGVSRQRCNAALKRLQESGILQIEYGGITVLDLPGLRRYVE